MLSAFKNFAVTMVVALLIFGLGAVFASKFLTRTMNSLLTSEKEQLSSIVNKDDGSESGEQDDPVNPKPMESVSGTDFSLLLVISDYRPDVYGDYIPPNVELVQGKSNEDEEETPYDNLGHLSADYREASAAAIVLITANKSSKQFTYTYFSPKSSIIVNDKTHTLGEAYSFYGTDVVMQHIHVLTGIRPTYHMTINGYNLDEFVDLLGPVTVMLSRDIYFDGKNYTTEFERTRETKGEDGEIYTEHLPNTFVMNAGGVQLDRENIGILSSVSERSMADINMKEHYTIEAVKQYLEKMSMMSADELRVLISKLTLKESRWNTIEIPWETEGPETEAPETEAPETEVPETEASETGDGETESVETEEPEETVYLFEPDTPIFETTFTTTDLESVGDILQAISLFEEVTVPYPGRFVNGTESSPSYYALDTKAGVELFSKYRKEGTSSTGNGRGR